MVRTTIIRKIRSLPNKQYLIFIVCIAIALLMPSVFTGLMGDDILHYMMLTQDIALPQRDDFSLFNLFSFIHQGNAFRLPYLGLSLIPWWTGSEFAWNFWRPLSELTHYMDYRWFGQQFWLMHVQSLFWFVVLLILLQRWFNDLFSSQRLALLALALFAFDSSHTITVAWLSNRHAILSSIGIVLTLLMHHQYREQQQVRYLVFACIALMFALLSGELGVCAGVWLFSYAVFIDKGTYKSRVLSLMPYLVIAVLWLYLYRLGDFGMSGYSAFYISPFEYPLSFIKNYVLNIPKAVIAQCLVIPTDVMQVKQYSHVIILFGYLLLGGLLFTANHVKEKSLYCFFLCAFILTLFPIASSPAQDRNMMQVSIAGAGLLAIICVNLYRYSRRRDPYHRLANYLLIIGMTLHLIISPLIIIPLSYLPELLTAPSRDRASSLVTREDQKIVIFKGDMMESIYLFPNLVVQNKPLPNRLWNVGGANTDLTVSVINQYQVQVDSSMAYFSSDDLMARDIVREPFMAGQQIDMDGLVIRVDEVADNGQPKRLTLIFSMPIDQVDFYQWKRGGYQSLDIVEQKRIAI